MFKLLHTSDWHLGRVLFNRPMLEDQEYFIQNVLLPALDAERPSLVIAAGDIFDRQIAPVDAIRLFNAAAEEICLKRGIPFAVIAGNHDSAERLSVYAGFLRAQGLFISARPFDTEPLLFEDENGEIAVHLLPYFDTAAARELLGRDSLRGYQEAFAAVVAELTARLVPGQRNILVSHCFVRGASVSDSESPLSIGGSAEVEHAVFSAFDYTALGHLHGPQQPGAHVFYSGSPLKYSFDEEHQHKSLATVEFQPEGAVVRRLPIQPLRDLRVVTGTVAELCAAAALDEHREDYLYARLTDTRPVYEPMAALRECYPNMLALNPGWLAGGEAQGGRREELRQGLREGSASDRVLFEEFMRQVCGQEPSADELSLFDRVMREVHKQES